MRCNIRCGRPADQYPLKVFLKSLLSCHKKCAVYERLSPFGFNILVGIDSGSNFVVCATAALNKEAGSLMAGYNEAVAQYGRPLRLRADDCYEASGIGADMIAHRGQSSYLPGPSTAHEASLYCTFYFLYCGIPMTWYECMILHLSAAQEGLFSFVSKNMALH